MRVAPAARANSWEDVADLSAAFGLVLDSWQEQVLQAAMGERRDGRWAAHQVGLSVPRQNGKSALLVARALAGALLFGERLIVVSAHEADTYRESTWTDLKNLIDSSTALASRIRPKGVMNAINRESVTFLNGSRIKFKARTGTGGRGFSSDCLLLDEAQRIPAPTWVSIYSTMSARDNPQIWLVGTPPTPEDDPFAFGAVRQAAMGGKSTSLAYLEWSADPDDDPAETATRAKANPAWFTRINHEVVQGEYETYPPVRFAMERLGIWADAGTTQRLVTPAVWNARKADIPPPALGGVAVGIKFSLDGTRVAACAARKPDSHGPHVETLGEWPITEGLGILETLLTTQWRKLGMIVIDGKAGRDVLAPALLRARIPQRLVILPTVDQVIAANATYLTSIEDATLTHANQPGLNASMASVTKRKIGTAGGWGMEPIGEGDEVPAEAAALAVWGTTKVRKPAAMPRRLY